MSCATIFDCGDWRGRIVDPWCHGRTEGGQRASGNASGFSHQKSPNQFNNNRRQRFGQRSDRLRPFTGDEELELGLCKSFSRIVMGSHEERTQTF